MKDFLFTMTPGKEQQDTGVHAHQPLGTGAPQTPAHSRTTSQGVGGVVREKEAAEEPCGPQLWSHAHSHVTACQLTPDTKQVGF